MPADVVTAKGRTLISLGSVAGGVAGLFVGDAVGVGDQVLLGLVCLAAVALGLLGTLVFGSSWWSLRQQAVGLLSGSRGMLVASKWTKSIPVDFVEVASDAITLRPKLRAVHRVERAEIRCVEYERVRVSPLWSSDDFYIRLANGRRAPKIFQPLHVDQFLHLLTGFGYTVVDVSNQSEERVNEPRDP